MTINMQALAKKHIIHRRSGVVQGIVAVSVEVSSMRDAPNLDACMRQDLEPVRDKLLISSFDLESAVVFSRHAGYCISDYESANVVQTADLLKTGTILWNPDNYKVIANRGYRPNSFFIVQKGALKDAFIAIELSGFNGRKGSSGISVSTDIVFSDPIQRTVVKDDVPKLSIVSSAHIAPIIAISHSSHNSGLMQINGGMRFGGYNTMPLSQIEDRIVKYIEFVSSAMYPILKGCEKGIDIRGAVEMAILDCRV
jgi:hypothetical protein